MNAPWLSPLEPPSRKPMSQPIERAIPALGAMPRAELGAFPSPVQEVNGLPRGKSLWLKRDDLVLPPLPGNKVRALEYLLAGVRRGDTVVTIGGEGSTHVLATAVLTAQLGGRAIAHRWPHEMGDAGRLVQPMAAMHGAEVFAASSIVTAAIAAKWRGMRRGARYIPLGGSTPLGIIGNVNAALELVEQIRAGMLPQPARVIVPMGSGGTAAGLLLGFALSGMRIPVVAARCGPRVGSNRLNVIRLARSTARFLRRQTGTRIPAVDPSLISVYHDAYGGAYGRPNPEADRAARDLARLHGPLLDATYGAKALLAALAIAGAPPLLLWVTFDSRLIASPLSQ